MAASFILRFCLSSPVPIQRGLLGALYTNLIRNSEGSFCDFFDTIPFVKLIHNTSPSGFSSTGQSNFDLVFIAASSYDIYLSKSILERSSVSP